MNESWSELWLEFKQFLKFCTFPVVTTGLMILLFVMLIMSIHGAYSWYLAGLQQDVWAREGIEMTRWEIWCGAKPAERVVNLKEPP